MVGCARAIHKNLGPMLSPGDTVTLDEPPNADVAPSLNYTGWKVKLQKRLLMPLRLNAKACDVLHVIDSEYLVGLSSSRLRRTVATCHDMLPFLVADRLEDVFQGRVGLGFYKRALKNLTRCAQVCTDSEFSKECIVKYTGCTPEQIEIIHLGVEDCFQPRDVEDEDIQRFIGQHGLKGKKIVLHVGSAGRYKNIETLLRVVADLKKTTQDDMVLLKIGGAFTAEHNEVIGTLRLDKSIVHLTGVSQEDLVRAYNVADLLLWPSHFEGFGLPVVEAMACGTPVVCSNGGSLGEIAGDAAAIHDPLDQEGLRASCVKVLTEPAYRSERIEAGLNRAKAFSWERAAAQYYDVYRKVCSQGT